MKNGTCVMCFSECSIHLRIAIWRETYLKQGSAHNPNLQFVHLNLILVCFMWNTHNTISVCLFEANVHYFALWTGWWKGLAFPVGGLLLKHPSTPCKDNILEVHKVETVYCQSIVYVFFFTAIFMMLCLHHQVSCSSSEVFLRCLALRIQLLGTCITNCACLKESNTCSKLHLILYTLYICHSSFVSAHCITTLHIQKPKFQNCVLGKMDSVFRNWFLFGASKLKI